MSAFSKKEVTLKVDETLSVQFSESADGDFQWDWKNTGNPNPAGLSVSHAWDATHSTFHVKASQPGTYEIDFVKMGWDKKPQETVRYIMEMK